MAVFADVGASLIVILNGMRLLRDKPQARRGVTSEGAPPPAGWSRRLTGRLERAHTAIG